MARITQLIHVNIVVSDIQESVKFYTEMLGARVIREWHGESETSGEVLGFGKGTARWHAFLLRWGEGDEMAFPQIDLLQWLDPPSVGKPYDTMAHVGIPRICLEVDNIDEIYAELAAKGVSFLTKPKPLNPKTERGSRTKIVCLLDPDGTTIELIGRGHPSADRPSK
ncbi:MAG: hypothetical protein GEU28_05720 [Dehalococcoidia bacterium]|nr:hypothetical protein [Dehalococcoidia bacterium]